MARNRKPLIIALRKGAPIRPIMEQGILSEGLDLIERTSPGSIRK